EYLVTRKAPNIEGSYMDFLRNSPAGDSFQNKNKDSVKEELDTSKVYSIIYVESDQTYLIGTIGGFLGGLLGVHLVGGVSGAIVGSVVPVVGTGIGYIVGVGGSAIIGAKLADDAQEQVQFSESKSFSGITLREYSVEDLRELNVDSFESIS
ncbi:MAG: hypothetical protein ACE5ES_04650, partial [Candidatus Nanoarchaeia archaeon]